MSQAHNAAQTAQNAQSAALPEQAMLAGTSVLTSDGALPVEFLQPGDRIVTRAGMRRLAAVQVSVVRNARVVTIAHGTLGVDQPEEDVTVVASQQVLVRDWRAKAMYGVPAALIPAAKLADGEYIRNRMLHEARLFTLVFQDEAVVYAGGLELVCPALAEVA